MKNVISFICDIILRLKGVTREAIPAAYVGTNSGLDRESGKSGKRLDTTGL